jgi:hypothetical protein
VIIWFLDQQQVGLFASFPKAFASNSLVMAAFRLRKSQLASLSCFLLHIINWNNPLLFQADFDSPNALPRAAYPEVLDPAITQFLTVSRTQLTNLVRDRVALIHPCAFRDFPVDSNL